MREVSIKGIRQGILLVLPEEPSWDEVVSQLDEKLAQAAALVGGAKAHIDLGDRTVSEAQLKTLISRLKETYAVEPDALVGGPNAQSLATALGLDSGAKPLERTAVVKSAEAVPGSNARYLRQTVRSGQVVHHDGHLIIEGDVNPGAELSATGDILVFGVLRGVAHAGCLGDAEAQIVANQLRPTQIRIAGFIARSPDNAHAPLSKFPEAARVKDGQIIIIPLKS